MRSRLHALERRPYPDSLLLEILNIKYQSFVARKLRRLEVLGRRGCGVDIPKMLRAGLQEIVHEFRVNGRQVDQTYSIDLVVELRKVQRGSYSASRSRMIFSPTAFSACSRSITER